MPKTSLMALDHLEQQILRLRGHNVMLDADLARLYGVETKTLVRATKRNLDRFPEDFMFQLSNQELTNLRYQIGTSSWGGRRTPPYAFTEQGVAMLSSVLRSKRAVHVNVEIMRAFVRLRALMTSQEKMWRELQRLEQKFEGQIQKHDGQIKAIFEAIRQLIQQPVKDTPRIGFKTK